MVKQEKLVELNDTLLNVLLKYRAEHPGFTFWLRTKESTRSGNKSRLYSGQWFQGSDYIFLSFHNISGHVNMTRSIGWVLILDEDLKPHFHVEVVWPKEPDQKKIDTYFQIIKTIGGFNKSTDTKYFKALPDEDPVKSLLNFIENILPQINSIIAKNNLKNQFTIPEDKFQKQLQRVLDIRSRINQNTDSRYANETFATTIKSMGLNRILYGPPGTGKTYNTIVKALSIIESKDEEVLNQESRNALKQRFDEYVAKERIAFTTFHQSFSYEDFIEGIKPEYDASINQLKYPIKSGLFKELCLAAIKNVYQHNSEETDIVDFDKVFELFTNHLKATYNEDAFPFTTKEGSRLRIGKDEIFDDYIRVYYEWSNSAVKKDVGKTAFPIKKSVLEKMFLGGVTTSETNLKARLQPYTTYHLSPYYAVYKSLIDFINTILSSKDNSLHKKIEETIEDDLSYESYIEKLQQLIKDKQNLNGGESYVLIIDEINRGNISQIFGELITLLEDDKRFGNEEALIVRLPYSKQNFAVPNNLHIIGTMNTADRSVEALDTALRRRFWFQEIPPNAKLLSPYKLLLDLWWQDPECYWNEEPYKSKEASLYSLFGIQKDIDEDKKNELWGLIREEEDKGKQLEHLKKAVVFKGINLETLLVTINKRIEKLLSKDHKIGHSYFLTVISLLQLKDAFQNKIIPLLQEYFYGDYGKIGLVIGKGFFDEGEEEVDEDVFAEFDYEESAIVDKKVYSLRNVVKMSDDEFRSAVALLTGENIKQPNVEAEII